jgi:hypothetical protein
MLLQRLLVIALVPYVAWLVFAYHWHFLDGVNLLFHEGGHMVFLPFGTTLHMLGGTIGQLFFPAACVFHFWRQERRFEAWICGIWLAESTMYMAEYLGDAKAMALPLVGGDTHDWHWILGRLGLVDWCTPISFVIHFFASLGAIACLGMAAALAFGWTLGASYGDARDGRVLPHPGNRRL